MRRCLCSLQGRECDGHCNWELPDDDWCAFCTATGRHESWCEVADYDVALRALAERVKALEALVTAQHEAIGELVDLIEQGDDAWTPWCPKCGDEKECFGCYPAEWDTHAAVTRICDRYRAAMEEAGWPDA